MATLAVMFSATTAQADTLQECQQKLLSGQLDLQGYLACISPTTTQQTSTNPTSSINNGNVNSGQASRVIPVSSTTTTGSLPTTGSNSGRYVGVGAALIVLGGAALYGATRSRRETPATETGTSDE